MARCEGRARKARWQQSLTGGPRFGRNRYTAILTRAVMLSVGYKTRFCEGFPCIGGASEFTTGAPALPGVTAAWVFTHFALVADRTGGHTHLNFGGRWMALEMRAACEKCGSVVASD